MSVFRRLSNLARGKVLEWQKALDDVEVDTDELATKAREAARRASEGLARAAASFTDPEPTAAEDATTSPAEEPAAEPVTPEATTDEEVPSSPKKRRL